MILTDVAGGPSLQGLFTRLDGDCITSGENARSAFLLRTVLELNACAQECLRRTGCAGFSHHSTSWECLLKMAACDEPKHNGQHFFYKKYSAVQPWSIIAQSTTSTPEGKRNYVKTKTTPLSFYTFIWWLVLLYFHFKFFFYHKNFPIVVA